MVPPAPQSLPPSKTRQDPCHFLTALQSTRVKLSTSIFFKARTSLTSWWEYYQGSDRNALRSWQTLKQCFCKFTSLNVIETCCASCAGRTGNLDQQPLTYRMTVHLFGAGLSPGCCNFALKKTAEDYEKELVSEPVEFLRRFLCRRWP